MQIPRIRKLANHTLSQSVPSSVVLTISSYTKVFLGELIETARRVQIEWQAMEDKFPNGEDVPEDATLQDRTKPEHRGPLTPDHLREALRRMKKDRVGGSAGFQGVSLTGKVSTVPKMGGRKLFR
jgi:transcription initiation factor TFIID subunit 11